MGLEVIYDGDGNALRNCRSGLWLRLGLGAAGPDPIDYAIRQLGFVRVLPLQSALIVEFQPKTASDFAVIAAFYEITKRAPRRIVLVCPDEPEPFEILHSPRQAILRIEALIKRKP